jgi:N,N'-diacetyllegionaminate synthase
MIFIAEIGMNHNGNINLCYELIKQAKYAGADIVKFQLGWRSNKGELNYIDDQDLSKIFEWGKHFEIEVMFSILDKNSLNRYLKFKPRRIKIASRTLLEENLSLAKEIINKKKETIISLGMWEKKTFPFKKNSKIKYLWCKSLYPTFDKHLKEFPKKFSSKTYDGFSDHTIGIETSLLAISRGAIIIERHFSLDKSDNTIRDHIISSTPSEFRLLVELGTEIHKKYKLNI